MIAAVPPSLRGPAVVPPTAPPSPQTIDDRAAQACKSLDFVRPAIKLIRFEKQNDGTVKVYCGAGKKATIYEVTLRPPPPPPAR